MSVAESAGEQERCDKPKEAVGLCELQELIEAGALELVYESDTRISGSNASVQLALENAGQSEQTWLTLRYESRATASRGYYFVESLGSNEKGSRHVVSPHHKDDPQRHSTEIIDLVFYPKHDNPKYNPAILYRYKNLLPGPVDTSAPAKDEPEVEDVVLTSDLL